MDLQDQTQQVDPKLPEYGRRLIVNVVDDYAQNEPDRVFAYSPISSEPKEGWRPITYKQLSNAVNYLAHEIVQRVGEKTSQENDFPTMAYIGPNDVRYAIFMLACIKAHHKAFFISPRNSLEGQISLFKATNCTALYFAESHLQTVLPWLEKHPMRIFRAASPEIWLESESPPFPYNRTYDEGRWDPHVVLHTSGSTGIPKPITMRQGSFAIADGLRNGPDFHGSVSAWSHMGTCKKFFLPMPLFHAAGIIAISSTGIFYGAALVFCTTDRPLSADLAIESIIHSGVDGALLPPSVVEDIGLTEDGISTLANLKFTAFGGGNVAPNIGDMLVARGVVFCNMISSTECMPYNLHLQSDPTLWQYFVINSKDMGAEFRQVDWDPEIYEMVLCHNDPKEPGRKAFFYTFPEKSEWPTGDLFKAHPTLPDHWRYHGRADNLIVFSNGEKLNPVTIEETMLGHPAIKGAIVVGDQRFQPALILEPVKIPADKAAAESLIADVWPLVEQVNKLTVSHGRILRDFIVISDPERPFARSPKGSIQRNPTIRDYKDFIDKVYNQVDEGVDMQGEVTLDLTSKDTLTQSLVDVLVRQIGNTKVSQDTDLFSVGVDSVQVIRLAKLLRSGLELGHVAVDKNAIAPRVIYANPTPKALAERLFPMLAGEGSHNNETSHEVEALAEMVLKYTTNLPSLNMAKTDPADDAQTVLVTGTTGSLGAYMLDRLVSNPRVHKIVALNRGDDGGQSRQAKFNSDRGLTTDFLKVEFLGVDLSQPDWALDPAKYDELLANADRIIHNAWPVNFVISISSFEPYIRGVRHLVDFSNKAAKRVPIAFISSIGTADGWTSKEPVPERQIANLELPQMGYGRSKLAGSLILDAAAERSGVPAATVRVGQIGGPTGKMGMWNKQEYIPSLVASSVYMGILPDSIGPIDVVDWTPVGDIAGLILDVSGVTAPVAVSEISGYFHGVNPCTTSWKEVAEVLREFYKSRIEKIVPLEEWVSALEESAEKADVEQNPGIKLLDTYRGMAAANRAGIGHVFFDMTRTVEHSATMKTLGPVNEEIVRTWCEQWNY